MSMDLSPQAARDVRLRAHDELVDALVRGGRIPADIDPGDGDAMNAAYNTAVGRTYADYTNGWAERAVYEETLRLQPGAVRIDDALRARIVEHLRAAVGVEQFGLDAETIANGIAEIITESRPNIAAPVASLDERIAVDRGSANPEDDGVVYVAFERRTLTAYAVPAPNQQAALARARLALRPQGHGSFRAEPVAESTHLVVESARILSVEDLHRLHLSGLSEGDRYAQTIGAQFATAVEPQPPML
jgi:hypothetical protein